MTRVSTINERFIKGKDFLKPAILKIGWEWAVMGVNLKWMGERVSSFEEAIAFVDKKRREHAK
jgi:hypothetical protein